MLLTPKEIIEGIDRSIRKYSTIDVVLDEKNACSLLIENGEVKVLLALYTFLYQQVLEGTASLSVLAALDKKEPSFENLPIVMLLEELCWLEFGAYPVDLLESYIHHTLQAQLVPFPPDYIVEQN